MSTTIATTSPDTKKRIQNCLNAFRKHLNELYTLRERYQRLYNIAYSLQLPNSIKRINEILNECAANIPKFPEEVFPIRCGYGSRTYKKLEEEYRKDIGWWWKSYHRFQPLSETRYGKVQYSTLVDKLLALNICNAKQYIDKETYHKLRVLRSNRGHQYVIECLPYTKKFTVTIYPHPTTYNWKKRELTFKYDNTIAWALVFLIPEGERKYWCGTIKDTAQCVSKASCDKVFQELEPLHQEERLERRKWANSTASN